MWFLAGAIYFFGLSYEGKDPFFLTSFNKKFRPNNFFGDQGGLAREKLKQAPRHFSPKRAEDGTTQVSIAKIPWDFSANNCKKQGAIYSGAFGQTNNAQIVAPSTLGFLAKQMQK